MSWENSMCQKSLCKILTPNIDITIIYKWLLAGWRVNRICVKFDRVIYKVLHGDTISLGNWFDICTLLKYWLWNILDARVKHRLMMQCSVSSSFVDNVPSFLWKNLSLDKAVNLHNILYFFMSPSLICTYVASSIYNKAWVTLTCTHICSYF